VEDGIVQLNSITQEDLGRFDPDNEIKQQAPMFMSFFEHLEGLVTQNVWPKSRGDESLGVSPDSSSEPPDPESLKPKRCLTSVEGSSTSPKKIRVESPESDTPPVAKFETPDRQTVPTDPTFTGDSHESIDEDNTKFMINTFVQQSISQLGGEFRVVQWPIYAKQCQLNISVYLHFHI
jgi:hypothetical protein